MNCSERRKLNRMRTICQQLTNSPGRTPIPMKVSLRVSPTIDVHPLHAGLSARFAPRAAQAIGPFLLDQVLEQPLPKLYVVGSIPIVRSRFLKLTTVSVDSRSRKSEQKTNFREPKRRLATKSPEKSRATERLRWPRAHATAFQSNMPLPFVERWLGHAPLRSTAIWGVAGLTSAR